MKAELKVKEAQAAEGAAYGAVAMVSHELRNCTQGISMTATTMMSETTSEPELRKLATTCETQLQHLKRALNGAIELGTLLSNVNKKVELVPISVRKIICNAVQGSTDYAAVNGVSLTATAEVQACNHYALTHEASVNSGLNNLIANAVRFTPKGGRITVGVEADDGPEGTAMRIIVTDTGCGIPENVQSKLLEVTAGATAQGAGIGLFTANQCIRRLANGFLKLRSSVLDEGTAWTINLVKAMPGPEEEEEEEPGGGEPASKRARIAGKADLTALFPGGVVIVDDDRVARIATKGALAARYGVAVRAYPSAQEFLDNMFRPPLAAAAGAGAAVTHDQPRCLILTFAQLRLYTCPPHSRCSRQPTVALLGLCTCRPRS